MKKIIFFDIDGTLIGHSFTVTEKNKQAIKQLKKNNYLVFLATGRPLSYIENEILDIGFDGVIASAGGTIYYQGQCIYEHPLDLKVLKNALKVLYKYEIPYGLECKDYYYTGFDLINKTIDRQIKSGQDKNVVINKFNQVKYKDIQYFDFDNPVSKLSAIILDEIQYDMLIKYLNDDFKIVRYGFAVDIIQKKWNKGDGAKYIMKYLGIDFQDSIAYGDSLNDLEIMKVVARPIVYEKAPQELLDVAVDTFIDPDRDGIYHSLKILEMI